MTGKKVLIAFAVIAVLAIVIALAVLGAQGKLTKKPEQVQANSGQTTKSSRMLYGNATMNSPNSPLAAQNASQLGALVNHVNGLGSAVDQMAQVPVATQQAANAVVTAQNAVNVAVAATNAAIDASSPKTANAAPSPAVAAANANSAIQNAAKAAQNAAEKAQAAQNAIVKEANEAAKANSAQKNLPAPMPTQMPTANGGNGGMAPMMDPNMNMVPASADSDNTTAHPISDLSANTTPFAGTTPAEFQPAPSPQANLLPLSWRTDAVPENAGTCAGGATWDAFAPKKAGFNKFIYANRNATFGLSTREPNPVKATRMDIFRPAPAVCVSAASVPFGDSPYRQDAIAAASVSMMTPQ